MRSFGLMAFFLGTASALLLPAGGAVAAGGQGHANGLSWTTQLPGVASVTGAYSDYFNTYIAQGNPSEYSATGSGDLASAVAPWRGLAQTSTSPYYSTQYTPTGDVATNVPFIFSNNYAAQGNPGAGSLTLTLAHPEAFFGALINNSGATSAASTVSFFGTSSANPLLTLALNDNGTYLSGPGVYAEFLNVSADPGTLFKTIVFNYAASSTLQNAIAVSEISVAAGQASFNYSYLDTANVPEPGGLGAMLGLFGLVGGIVALRRPVALSRPSVLSV